MFEGWFRSQEQQQGTGERWEAAAGSIRAQHSSQPYPASSPSRQQEGWGAGPLRTATAAGGYGAGGGQGQGGGGGFLSTGYSQAGGPVTGFSSPARNFQGASYSQQGPSYSQYGPGSAPATAASTPTKDSIREVFMRATASGTQAEQRAAYSLPLVGAWGRGASTAYLGGGGGCV